MAPGGIWSCARTCFDFLPFTQEPQIYVTIFMDIIKDLGQNTTFKDIYYSVVQGSKNVNRLRCVHVTKHGVFIKIPLFSEHSGTEDRLMSRQLENCRLDDSDS